jgi:uncharacterized protein YvpB
MTLTHRRLPARRLSSRCLSALFVCGAILCSACADDPLLSSGAVEGEGDLAKSDRAGAGQVSVRLVVSDPCENPCSLSAEVSGAGVAKVRYEAESWVLGSNDDAESDFAISYTFNQLGERTFSAVALSASGVELAKSSARARVVSAARAEGELPPVPYFYQFANALSPGATCQNTSIAMVLNYLGWRGRPDDITRAYGRARAQTPSGLAEVFNAYARELGLSARMTPTQSGSLAGLRAELDRGEPVVIHGYFTSAGHVVVVLGYDAGGYYVNDPAGTWSQSFKGGYPNGWEPSAGRAVYYSKAAFERAVSTLDGYTFEPLWYSALR